MWVVKYLPSGNEAVTYRTRDYARNDVRDSEKEMDFSHVRHTYLSSYSYAYSYNLYISTLVDV